MKISIILLIMLCVLYLLFGRVYMVWGEKYPWSMAKTNTDRPQFFFIIAVTFLILIAAFRGDFSTDYRIYFYQIKIYASNTILELLQSRDFGFALFTKLVSFFTNNYLWCFIIMSAVTVILYAVVIHKESAHYLLSLLLLVAVDNYIVSFNLMRNILAVALYLYVAKYIWEKNLLRYLIGVLLIATIHRTAIIMLPMYWLLNVDFRKRRNLWILLGGMAAFIIALLNTQFIAITIQDLIGMDYLSYDTYGLDFGNIGSAMKTSVLLGYVLFCWKKIDFDDTKQRIWFNGCLYNWCLQILASRLLMIQRVGYFFSAFYVLLIPMIVMKSSPRRKQFMLFAIVLFLFIYDGFFQNVTEYYPIWENKYFRF